MFNKKSNSAVAIVVIIVLVAIVVFVWTNKPLRNQIDTISGSQNTAQQTYEDKAKIELSGKKTCLKPSKQPSTRECTAGFIAEDGRYYALKNAKKLEGVAVDQKVWITGIYHKTKSTRYKTSGTIEIQSVSINYGNPGGIDL